MPPACLAEGPDLVLREIEVQALQRLRRWLKPRLDGRARDAVPSQAANL